MSKDMPITAEDTGSSPGWPTTQRLLDELMRPVVVPLAEQLEFAPVAA
ncbi:hypothetical protein [Streptomyces himalayensis]|uniref:Uncharacterized protein n=1 Tax=Streptomyces himalayensis subsp. himalayensis TaxID=2756131 RepID=A0A7W0DGY6_9ACTN|nr:hypothetical protein [Streptomyces himalayensis]MBA2944906.1 hypothetical protein [Streptomyces himalayensis subsp. himalayensis]